MTLVLAAWASGSTIRSEHDRSVDFTAHTSFGFFDVLWTDQDGYETLVTNTLKTSTRREMEARGYRYEAAGADLLVNFNVRLADRVEVTPKPMPGLEYYGYRNYVTWRDYNVVVDQYKEGMLNIGVVDANQQRLIWEGIATGRVTEKASRNREAAIDHAVTELFATCPVPARP